MERNASPNPCRHVPRGNRGATLATSHHSSASFNRHPLRLLGNIYIYIYNCRKKEGVLASFLQFLFLILSFSFTDAKLLNVVCVYAFLFRFYFFFWSFAWRSKAKRKRKREREREREVQAGAKQSSRCHKPSNSNKA